MDTALELVGVSKRFGPTLALDRLDLAVPRGSFLGLLGRNGAGKTTTISLATGLLQPTAGKVLVLGVDLASRPLAVKRRIGVMPQETSTLDCLTGVQYLDFVGSIHGIDGDEIARRRRELWSALELEPAKGALVRDFSYGMRKKLSLCAALLHGPELLFLDEPFEGIDPVTSRTIKNMLLSLRRKGLTILMSSHVLDVVQRLCPLVAIIDEGRLLGYGPIEKLRAEHGGASLEEIFVGLMGGSKSGELSWL